MTEWNPTIGPRMAVGWRAIRQHIIDNGPSTWIPVKEAARKNSDLKAETCQNIISQAVKHGYLTKTGRKYDLTNKGRATL